MVQGVDQIGTFLIAPMLGGHPEEIFPRFRDCFLQERGFEEVDGLPFNVPIYIYTRIGGGNREDYQEEISKLRSLPEYIRDFDDDYDCTFATFVFRVPEKWKKDFELINQRKIKKTSKEYQNMILDTFPKIADKLRELFKDDNEIIPA
jgi:hypothetical protein